jgi:hypothetical protein
MYAPYNMHSRTSPYTMRITGVQVCVKEPDFLRALDDGGREWPTNVRREGSADWRALRNRLIELSWADKNAVAGWLQDAGYVARIRQFNPLDPNGADERQWIPEYVTPAITTWLRLRKDVIGLLMTVERNEFLAAVDAVSRYPRKTDIAADEVDFKRALERIMDVSNLDAQVLFDFLIGTGMAPYLNAGFNWGPRGRATVTVFTDSPIEAIGISIHIDRNFSVRQWIKCARAGCSNTFEREKSSYRYCSDKCADYCTTNERRAKIKLLKQANIAWKKLPRDERKCQNHWQWIAEWVGRQSGDAYKVTPAWAKKELTKKMKNAVRGDLSQ